MSDERLPTPLQAFALMGLGIAIVALLSLITDRFAPAAEPKPAPIRMTALDCPAPAEGQIAVITARLRDGRIVAECNYVRGSDSAAKRRRP